MTWPGKNAHKVVGLATVRHARAQLDEFAIDVLKELEAGVKNDLPDDMEPGSN